MQQIGDRIKNNYENRSRYYLTRRVPVILRIDGKAFHTYTQGFQRPFDKTLMNTMVFAASMACKQMQGFKCAYVQSDEISILLTDYDTLQTCAWFDYNIQKLSSISASLITAYFNEQIGDYTNKLAMFDCRCFNVPKEEVVNYFLWRAKDWERNSISMYCNSFFSHKEMHGKSKEDQHEMLYSIGKNWSTDLSDREKNGTFILRDSVPYNCIKPLYSEINTYLNPLIYCEKD